MLSQEKMTNILWDLLRADEFVYNYALKDSTRDKKQESIKLYEQVFRIHGTSKEQFEKSFTFYQSRPDLFKEVMDSLRRYEIYQVDESSQTTSVPDSIKVKLGIKRPVRN